MMFGVFNTNYWPALRVEHHVQELSAPAVESRLLNEARQAGFSGTIGELLQLKGWAIMPLDSSAWVEVPKAERCTAPPAGWECSREPGHEGPCAATEEQSRKVDDALGLVELPVIRISKEAYLQLLQIGRKKGIGPIQAVVRDVLANGLRAEGMPDLRRLEREARVGDTVFGVGVPERVVVEAAQVAAMHPTGKLRARVVAGESLLRPATTPAELPRGPVDLSRVPRSFA